MNNEIFNEAATNTHRSSSPLRGRLKNKIKTAKEGVCLCEWLWRSVSCTLFLARILALLD